MPAVPKSKKTLALAKPSVWLALLKSKLRVCQAPATVVVACTSAYFGPPGGLSRVSSFSSTLVPASGDHTRMVTSGFSAVASSPVGRLRKVVPAQVWAPADLTIWATRPDEPVGGLTAMDDPAPPKS